jgi:hypothetical protein
MEERFSDFKAFDGLSLPTNWEVRFTEDIPVSPEHPGVHGVYGRSSTKIWTMTEDNIINNGSLDPRNFFVKMSELSEVCPAHLSIAVRRSPGEQ